MVHDTLPSQDASTHQIWDSFLKEYRRYAPTSKNIGDMHRTQSRAEGRTVGWGHKNKMHYVTANLSPLQVNKKIHPPPPPILLAIKHYTVSALTVVMNWWCWSHKFTPSKKGIKNVGYNVLTLMVTWLVAMSGGNVVATSGGNIWWPNLMTLMMILMELATSGDDVWWLYHVWWHRWWNEWCYIWRWVWWFWWQCQGQHLVFVSSGTIWWRCP